MAETVFTSFNIGGQGLSVQRMRLNSIARNIANANTTKAEDGEPYKREVTVIHAVGEGSFGSELSQQMKLSGSGTRSVGGMYARKVVEATTSHDESEPRQVYDPSHPDADENGYVKMPNINVVNEMVEMISAQRAFEANVNVIESAKNIARDSLDI